LAVAALGIVLDDVATNSVVPSLGRSELLPDHARRQVGDRAGGKADHDADRLARIGFGRGGRSREST
jgi:hypothetical protein